MGGQKAIFLDRDGVINKEIEYLHEPSKFEFIPKVPEAIKRLKEAGFLIIIITNQAGIAKGYFQEEDTLKTHVYMVARLAEYGITLTDIYYCPHRDQDECECRKPKPGMIYQGIKKHTVDPKRSWLVGDKISDIIAGNRAGLRSILVKTGHGKDELRQAEKSGTNPSKMDHPYKICLDLWDAANFILDSPQS